MIRKIFKKPKTDETFGLELTKKVFDTQWLQECLTSKSVDINFQNKSGDTFLILAIKTGKYLAAQWLIDNGADISIKNDDGKNALDIAVEKDNLAVVKGLLDTKKIDANQKDASQRSLLQNIVVQGNFQMAKVLLQHGADINSQDKYGRIVLYDALVYGDQHFLRYLLSLDKLNINHIDEEGNSLLHYQEVVQSDSIAKDIIIAGIDTTITKGDEDSYFYKTMLRDDKYSQAIFELALSHGANVNARTISGNTLMMELIFIASNLPKEESKKRTLYLHRASSMMEYHGDINALNQDGETGLFHPIRTLDMPLCGFLLSHKIDTNIQDSKGKPVLEYAIYYGLDQWKLILMLLDHKADPNQRNNKGKTIFEMLNDILLHQLGTKTLEDKEIEQKIDKNGQYIEIVKKLLELNKVELNYLDSSGDPLFFKPLLYDHFTLFRLYIRFGLDIHLVNKANHNIFFEYVLLIFEKNISTAKVCDNFQHNLSNLMSAKVNKNYQDALGWTIMHKIMSTPCDEKLFDILTKVVPFDFTMIDNLGRTPIHNAVWGNKQNIIKKIATLSKESINIEDNYKILPIVYAALLGNAQMVLLFLRLGSLVHSNKKIDSKAIKKFSPMLKNLEKNLEGIENQSDINNLQTVIEQIRKDFAQ